MTAKTRKILDIHENGKRIYCIKNSENSANPYSVYKTYYDSDYKKRTKKLESFADFASVMHYITYIFTN